MAINKVIYGNQTLIDLTQDDVTAADIARGGLYYIINCLGYFICLEIY